MVLRSVIAWYCTRKGNTIIVGFLLSHKENTFLFYFVGFVLIRAFFYTEYDNKNIRDGIVSSWEMEKMASLFYKPQYSH